jgi:hypothetical protein
MQTKWAGRIVKFSSSLPMKTLVETGIEMPTRRRPGLRRSALATALIGASILVGTGVFVPSAAAAALCASPPL